MSTDSRRIAKTKTHKQNKTKQNNCSKDASGDPDMREIDQNDVTINLIKKKENAKPLKLVKSHCSGVIPFPKKIYSKKWQKKTKQFYGKTFKPKIQHISLAAIKKIFFIFYKINQKRKKSDKERIIRQEKLKQK